MSTRLAQNGKVCLAFRYVPCYAELKLQCLSIYFKYTYICYRSSCISNKPTPGGKSGYFQCTLPNCPHSLNNDLQVNLMYGYVSLLLWVTHATYVRIQFSLFLDSQFFSLLFLEFFISRRPLVVQILNAEICLSPEGVMLIVLISAFRLALFRRVSIRNF